MRAILFRPLYRGEVVWGKAQKRDAWGHVAPKRRPEGEWLRTPAPHLRLVGLTRPGLTLGDLFTVWGRPLGRDRLAAARGPVTVHLDGRRWTADPRDGPLRPYAQIVVQAGAPLVEPHASYRFPPR